MIRQPLLRNGSAETWSALRIGSKTRRLGLDSPPTLPSAADRIRLLLVDDHPIVRNGLAYALTCCEHLQVAGEAGDGEDALRKARELKPDVVLMDLEMPRMNGLAATERLRAEHSSSKVIIFSRHSFTDYVLEAIRSGAHGYVLKGASPEQIVEAIRSVHAGRAFFSPELAGRTLTRMAAGNALDDVRMSPREQQVLVCIAEGSSNKEIAHRLAIGVRTVETFRERVMSKLQIRSTAGLTRYALARGLVALGEPRASLVPALSVHELAQQRTHSRQLCALRV